MSNLAGSACRSGPKLSIKDDPAANPGTKGNHHHIANCFAGAKTELAECCDIGIISHQNR